MILFDMDTVCFMKCSYVKPEAFVFGVCSRSSFLQITSPCYGVDEGTAQGTDIPVVDG